MQSALWITLILMLAMDSALGGKPLRRCRCPKPNSGDCSIPARCHCPLVKSLCRSKPKTTLVGKRNAGVQLSELDFVTFNRHLREAEELLELENKNIYSSPGQRSRLRRWKTND